MVQYQRISLAFIVNMQYKFSKLAILNALWNKFQNM